MSSSGASQLIPLSGNRRVAISEYGVKTGAPVFFCHGWPSSRTMGELTDAAARDLGLHIISPDRPGIRDSSFQPERRLLDWPPLVRELADKSGIEQFKILGISGGAPYALATAWALPERVRAVAVVSGAPPLADLIDRGGLLPLYRWLLFFYPHHRELLRFSFFSCASRSSLTFSRACAVRSALVIRGSFVGLIIPQVCGRSKRAARRLIKCNTRR